MGHLVADIARERAAVVDTLLSVGPDAPTACGSFTATDLAIHLALGEAALGLPNAPFRWLVSRGVRLDALAGFNGRALESYRQRRSFEWAVARLRRPTHVVQRVGAVGAVTLMELWAHHEDVIAANDVPACDSRVDLAPVLAVLRRYQRKALAELDVIVAVADQPAPDGHRTLVRGGLDDLCRWLTGRGGLDQLVVEGDVDAARGLAMRL